MNKTVVGLYDEISEARSVVQELVDAGFERDSISLVANASAQEYERYFDKEGQFRGDAAEEVTATEAGEGAGIGAVVGGLGGVLMGFGLLAIPGVGPALAAGPLIAGLLGAGAGAVVGGLVGALVQSGVPEEVAGNYAEAVRRGGSLVSIISDDSRSSEAETIMNRHFPIDLEERIATWRDEGFTGHDPKAEPYERDMIHQERQRVQPSEKTGEISRETVIPIVEEELAVGKRDVERGGVRVHTRLVEEPFDETVTLRDEEVHVSRRPLDRAIRSSDDAFEEHTIELTETDEEPVIEKRARVTGEVVIGKEAQEHTEQVRGTLRHTEVDVENLSDDGAADYHEHFSAAFGALGRRYEDYEPAYRFGRDLAGERGADASWSRVESEARRDWEAAHPGTWEEFRDAIHYSFDKEHSDA